MEPKVSQVVDPTIDINLDEPISPLAAPVKVTPPPPRKPAPPPPRSVRGAIYAFLLIVLAVAMILNNRGLLIPVLTRAHLL